MSRITVRQALEKLVDDGLIYRRRGRGTFVAVPGIEQGLNRIVSFTEDMRRRGLHPGTEVISARAEPASEAIAEKLQVSAGEELARFERLRLADGEPMSIEVSHLILRYCPGILQHDYAQRPLREELEKSYGLHLVRAQQVIRAVGAAPALARQLSVPAQAPLFYIERVSFSQLDDSRRVSTTVSPGRSLHALQRAARLARWLFPEYLGHGYCLFGRNVD